MRKTFLLLFLIASIACAAQSFVPPLIPNKLNNKDEREEYLVLHYWDNYDFEDPYIFLEGDIMLNYFSCLREVSYRTSNASIHQTLESASRNNQIFSLFIDAYRVYLFNPESFFCDYEKYLAVDEYVINNERISQSKKRGFELERKVINTNRIGTTATDFVVMDKENNPIELYGIEAEYLLVFFHNPNCGICAETKEKLSKSEAVGEMMETGSLKVLTVCPYDEYDLWKATDYPEKWLNGYDTEGRINSEKLYYFLESSNLYLLDRDKRVLKKDIRLDLLEEYLMGLMDGG